MSRNVRSNFLTDKATFGNSTMPIDPTQHTHTINYTTGLTNYKIDIPETFISTDGMSASISIQPETDTKIDNLISPFIMVDYLIKT